MSIQSEITRIASAKSDIADAIEAKGVTVPTGTKIDGMATLIGQIYSGQGSAVTITETTDPVHGGTVVEVTSVDLSNDTVRADKLATGYTAHDASGTAIIGTMSPGGSPTGTKQISIVSNGTITENVSEYANAEITTAVPRIKEIAIRPDAELWKSWTYDKRIVEDEKVTIPAYQETAVTLKATEQIDEITADAANYKYFLTFRTLVIPEYNTGNVARGRFEWSSMVGAYEFVFTPMAELHPLVAGTYSIATNSAAVQGGVSYRSLYFTSATGISIYATTSYGIWTTSVAPTYVTGKIKINSPNFTMRAQANILDQSFYEALTDIRFQYVYELWRVPIGSLQYDGWSNQQLVDHSLACLSNSNHKLT